MKGIKSTSKRILSGLLTTAMTAGLAFGAVPFTAQTAEAAGNFNYGDAFSKSLMFYEFQKSGDLDESTQRNNWRGDSGMNDGSDVGLDLTGGWYDAGDHVKFNLPMSYTATMLAWSYLEDTDVYKTSGQDKYMLDEIKWANDYFIKCHPSANVYYYQVGDGGLDHAVWCSAEVMQMSRPAYKLDMSNPGSAVSAGTAASLAAAAIVFQDIDPAYAATCLKHSKELLAFAEATKSDAGYTKANGYYTSFSGFNDEISWANTWLYMATGDESYLDKAKQYSAGWEKKDQTDEIAYTWAHSWDDVHIGTCLLLAKYAGETGFKKVIENHLDYWTVGIDGNRIKYTPKGLAWLDTWGSLRYASTTAFLAAIYADWDGADAARAKYCQDFAKTTADYILGSTGRSFVVGFGVNPPKNPHHRTAHGAWENNVSGAPAVSRHTLVGALVGGPDASDGYTDSRSDYISNEVADDYNAGFVGLMAKMYDDYGGTIDPNLNAFEEVGEEIFLEAGINAQDKNNAINFIELKAVVYNRSAWPARVTDKLSYRFFVDISDVLAQGYSASDMKVNSSYSQGKSKISGLKAWDAANGIYYVDIDLTGNKIYPGGQSEQKSEIQFRIAAPGKWDYTKSPSYKGLSASGSNSLVRATNMPLYDDGVLIFGQEPNGGSVVPTVKPTVKPTTVPTVKPTTVPTVKPTTVPTVKPTTAPTAKPTTVPTVNPSNDITVNVTTQGGSSTNTIGGQFTVTTKKAINLSDLEIRYYYTVEGNNSQVTFKDHAGLSMNRAPWYSNVTDIVNVNTVQVSGNEYYMEITFASDETLDASGKLDMGIRLAKSDWSAFDQGNDYSFENGAVVIYNNTVVSGELPY